MDVGVDEVAADVVVVELTEEEVAIIKRDKVLIEVVKDAVEADVEMNVKARIVPLQ